MLPGCLVIREMALHTDRPLSFACNAPLAWVLWMICKSASRNQKSVRLFSDLGISFARRPETSGRMALPDRPPVRLRPTDPPFPGITKPLRSAAENAAGQAAAKRSKKRSR